MIGPLFWDFKSLKTASQFGRPDFLRALNPVIKSRSIWNQLSSFLAFKTSQDKEFSKLYDFILMFELQNTFLYKSSRAKYNRAVLMSSCWRADVMYMWISRNLSMAPPFSFCSNSNWVRSWWNHSIGPVSRLIQIKSTCNYKTSEYSFS